MFSFFRWPSARVALLVLGMTAATITPIVISTPASSQNTVPSETPSPQHHPLQHHPLQHHLQLQQLTYLMFPQIIGRVPSFKP